MITEIYLLMKEKLTYYINFGKSVHYLYEDFI